jgi:hypothetical protein
MSTVLRTAWPPPPACSGATSARASTPCWATRQRTSSSPVMSARWSRGGCARPACTRAGSRTRRHCPSGCSSPSTGLASPGAPTRSPCAWPPTPSASGARSSSYGSRVPSRGEDPLAAEPAWVLTDAGRAALAPGEDGRCAGATYAPTSAASFRRERACRSVRVSARPPSGGAWRRPARNGVCVHGGDLKRYVVSRESGAVEQGLSYVGGAALPDVFLDAATSSWSSSSSSRARGTSSASCGR